MVPRMEQFVKSTRSFVVLAIVGLVVVAAFVFRSVRSEEPPQHQVEAQNGNVPAFVELGSDRCNSCRAMIPVLEELRSTYGCNLNVRFVDVWDNPEEGERFGVRTIPTQVLLAPDGQEIIRHTGFWSADAITAAFASGGYPLEGASGSCGP